MSRRPPATLALVGLVMLLAAAARADTTTALGDRSGEGSTPFTALAQAPEANLFTGALGTGIPIAVPPGRRSMTPQLALRYSSSGGPGPFGHGWDLPIGRIERGTAGGVPRCTGPHIDDFVLVLPSGATELVQESNGSTVYRPRVEQAWLRAERQSQNFWVVTDRGGTKYTFGDQDSARVSNATPPVFLSPQPDGSCHLTTQWALTRIEDTNGNVIEVSWSKILNVLYPATVRWGGSSVGGGPPHTYTVRFLPEYRPPLDRIASSRTGVPSRLIWRIYQIDVETDVPAPGTPVRSYLLQYADAPAGGTPTGYQSLLSAVTVTGQPTQHLAYTASAAGHRGETVQIAKPPAAYGELRVANDSLEVSQSVLDMNGDGLLDLVRSDDPSPPTWSVFWGEVTAAGFGFRSTAVPWQAPGNWLHLRNVVVSSGGCNLNGWSCTETDTFDLTGDGIPDHVDASNSLAWIVYPGRGVPQWGFAPGFPWPAANTQYIRRSHQGDTYQDVVDVTGDGRPDLVVGGPPGAAAPHRWDVYVNTGAGFSPVPLLWPAPYGALADKAPGGLAHQLVDFNGDGLPDIVRTGIAGVGGGVDSRCSPSDFIHASCLEVHLNTGQGFGAPEPLIPVPLSWTVQETETDGSVVQDLVDINGDGLPDWIHRRFNYQQQAYEPEWRVLLNLGGTLEPVAFGPHSALAPPYQEAIATRIWAHAQGPLRRTIDGNTRTDLIDLNGDGFLDHVTAGGPSWTVRLHAAVEKPNLLGLMENGLGGTNTIVYRPSTAYDNSGGDAQPDLPYVVWVVDRMRQNDGLCTPSPGADVFTPGPAPALNHCIDAGHELVARFAYQDGRFDPAERDFRGFRRVVRTSVEGSAEPANQTVTVFGQLSTISGRILQVDTYAGDAVLVRSEQNVWGTRPAGTRTQLWLAQNSRATYDLGAPTPQLVLNVSDPPDDYGNVLHHYTAGLFDAARVDTYTTYAAPSGSWRVYDKPANVRIVDATGVLEERWFHYDGSGANGMALGAVSKGNLKRVRSRLSPSQANGPETKMAYDAYGNLIRATDANGRVTTTTYDDRLLYPRSVVTPLGHETVTTIDYRWGQPISIRDANGATTYFAYDGAGRRTCVARPPDTLADCSVRYTYQFAAGPGALSWVESAERQDAPRPPLTVRHFFDALGRPRYSERFQVVQGAPTIVRTAHTVYDAGGRVLALHHPYLVAAPSPDNGATTYDYHLNGSALVDPLGRVHRTTHSDGTARRTEYAGALTATFDEDGQRSETLSDAHGRVVRQTTYDGPTPYATVDRAYDGLGRLLEVRQNGIRTQAIAYDNLGRKTQMTDQDSGTWRYGYDGAGNLLWQDDPAPGRHVQFCYDGADRPTRRCPVATDFQQYFSCTSMVACGDPETVLYTYDAAAVPFGRGRLTSVVDASGETAIHAYDARGRQLRLTRTIDAGGSGHATFEYTYDTNDRISSIRYPDGETLLVDYDDAGQPIALHNTGMAFYVVDARYDLFGRPTLIAHENGVEDRRVYGGPLARHRLQDLTSARGSSRLIHLAYEQYTNRGLLARLTDQRHLLGELSNTAVFAYDALGRLTGFDSVHGPADRLFAHDAMGNLTRHGDRYLTYGDPSRPHQLTRVNLGGPGGPAQTIGHDANGNRLGKQGQTYVYDTSGRVAEIAVGNASLGLRYDYRGQLAAKIVDGNPQIVTRYYSALAETTNGYLTKSYYLGTIRVASRSTSYTPWEITAAGGGGAIRLAAAALGAPALVVEIAREARWMLGAVLFSIVTGLLLLPSRRRRPVLGLRIRTGHALLVALACAIGTLPWPIIVQAPVEAGGYGSTVLRHYHLDHLGSTQVISDAAGNPVEQIRYLPYGQVRGRWNASGQPIGASSGVNRREFTGHELEPLSGLLYAGARFYDPELGLFLTHDPATQFASPYSYGGGDPVNWTDPTGGEFVTLLIALGVAALASAAINAIIAAAQGLPLSAIGRSALGGAIAGAAGVGLGIVASAASMGAAAAAGTLPANVTFQEALTALGEVAARSAFSTTVANTAGQVASAAGASGEVTLAVSMAAGILGSFAYDQAFLNPTGDIARAADPQACTCSTTGDHSNITMVAAEDASYSYADATRVLNSNLERDQGWINVLNNQSHFDYAARSYANNFSETAYDLIGSGAKLNGTRPIDAQLLRAVGSATHHIQDRYALGHILPGTSLLKGPQGAPFRFIIHNVIGGEVAFRQASYDATRTFLNSIRSAGTPI